MTYNSSCMVICARYVTIFKEHTHQNVFFCPSGFFLYVQRQKSEKVELKLNLFYDLTSYRFMNKMMINLSGQM